MSTRGHEHQCLADIAQCVRNSENEVENKQEESGSRASVGILEELPFAETDAASVMVRYQLPVQHFLFIGST